MWDYKWLENKRIQGSHVEGLWEYRELQFLVLIARLLAWGMIKHVQDATLMMWTSAFLGIVSLVVSSSLELSEQRRYTGHWGY